MRRTLKKKTVSTKKRKKVRTNIMIDNDRRTEAVQPRKRSTMPYVLLGVCLVALSSLVITSNITLPFTEKTSALLAAITFNIGVFCLFKPLLNAVDGGRQAPMSYTEYSLSRIKQLLEQQRK